MRFVRHPIYLGWFLVVWGAPDMNGTRLAFAAASCFYLLLAITFEERDLRRTFGAAYGQLHAARPMESGAGRALIEDMTPGAFFIRRSRACCRATRPGKSSTDVMGSRTGAGTWHS